MAEFKLQHLITTGTREAEMIEALLNDNGIELIVRHDETGDYTMLYMGYSAFNIELYVAEKDYKEAKELLESLNIEATEEIKEADQSRELKSDKNRNRNFSFYLAQIAKIIIVLYLLLHLLPLFF
ncbi:MULTISPECIES: putative signal transducing protein [Halanaerobium]|jgi:hydrogenase maturation factor|uniref:Putative signal transducing protein n=1 Tax=Halanaerobium kushneri TaxID=56779 RepID=A0A1N7BAD3_9FIRM|nr:MULTISPECIES: DUF2007 domain-containing protein [Halanaerobium]RCW58689.1 putative signal transducing protein [Halanaerobium sp. ST460_2HS_T2]SIR48268.1 Putative signal transducing protein [Halanaerobium kushneri]